MGEPGSQEPRVIAMSPPRTTHADREQRTFDATRTATPVQAPAARGPGTLPQGALERRDLAAPQLVDREVSWGGAADQEPTRRVPIYSVFDEGDEVSVEVELPGVDPEDLEVRGFRDRLHVEAERNPLEVEGDREALAGWTGPARFDVAIPLEIEVEPADAVARFGSGMLTVAFPKADPGDGFAAIPVQE